MLRPLMHSGDIVIRMIMALDARRMLSIVSQGRLFAVGCHLELVPPYSQVHRDFSPLRHTDH